MLFKDIPTLKKYAQISGTPNLESFKASLRMVESKYIASILGKELYTELNDDFNDEDVTLTEPQVNLLHQCRMIIGPAFCYQHADKADIFFSDAGMQRLETATNKTAYQEQRTKFKNINLQEAENAIELLIQFLEENIDDYPEWVGSSSFTDYRSLFIKTGTAFQKLFHSAAPYRNYIALRPKMVDIEENNIRPFLGDELYNALKDIAADPDGEYSEKQEQLLSKIKKAIANFSVAFSIPLLHVRIDGNGLTVPAMASFSDNNEDNTRSGMNDKTLFTMIESCTNTGKEWLENAKQFLLTNKETFPDWPGHPATSCPAPKLNDGLKTVFGL